jgi:replicative superfamily II helicase
MKVIYEDEYGVELFSRSVNYAPLVGDSVVIVDEEYRIESRTYYPESDAMIITVTQTAIHAVKAEVNNSGRLADLGNAIIKTNKRQDVSEKKSKAISEQVSSIRRHINQRIQQEKKDTP